MGGERRVLADGRAILFCGDSLRLLGGGVLGHFDAIVSDPPYGIAYRHSGGASSSITRSKPKTDAIVGDDAAFNPLPWVEAAPLACDGTRRILLWGADHFRARLPDGGTFLAWDKHVGYGSDDSFADAEFAWCGRRVKRSVFRWLWKGVLTNKSSLDVATTPPVNGLSGKVFARVHVSQKPVELMRWSIERCRVPPDGVVLDPYMGSGTTGVAALSMGLRFCGVEVDPEIFEGACRRIELTWSIMKEGRP